jgi:hypothetical protein
LNTNRKLHAKYLRKKGVIMYPINTKKERADPHICSLHFNGILFKVLRE